jgi:hypothetical protein
MNQRSHRWWQKLVAERSTLSRRSGRPFFALKLQRGHAGDHPRALRATIEPLSRQGLWLDSHQQKPALIALFRSNWRGAVLSHHLALSCGAFDQGRIVTFQHRPIAMLGDPLALQQDLTAHRLQLEWLLACSQQNDLAVRVVEHESLVSDQVTTLNALVELFDGPGPHPAALNAPPLDLRIARESSSWVVRRQAWMTHLHKCFDAADLHRHPEALHCQDLVNRLKRSTL